MRVAIVTESFLPHVNGVTNSILRVLEHLADTGHEAIVLAPSAAGRVPAEYAGFPVVPLTSVPMPGYPDVQIGTVTSFTIERILADFAPHVLHVASPLLVGYRALLAARRLLLPSVAVYQTDVPSYAARYGAAAMEPLLWWRIRQIHSLADLNLAPSQASLDQLRAQGIGHVRQWQRGVDQVRFHPNRRDDAWRATVAPGRSIIGYVGRLASEKQVRDLAVLADLPEVTTVIVGDGPCRAELETALPDVVFLGHRDGDDLARIVASLDLFVHPGELETFGQSIQEALASGVPVIAPAKGGPLQLIRPSHNGWLYAPGDLAGLRAHAADLLGDERKRRAFGADARASVSHRTWRGLCEQLLGHYGAAILTQRQATGAGSTTPPTPVG